MLYQYQMLDYSGQTIYTAPTEKSISYLGDGLYRLSESYYYSQLMDSAGNLICDTKFGLIQPFSGGYAIVKDQNNMDGKYGIIDKEGAFIVPYRYDMPANASSYDSNIEDGVTVLIDSVTGKSVRITLPETIAPATYTAVPSAARVLINGKEVAFDAYIINNNNYFKLRDLAYALSGNEKRFDVIWNGEKNAIELASGNNYTPVGGELSNGDGTTKRCTLNTSKIYLEGREITLTAYNIGGNNYFKLRDVMKAFDISVGWDEANSTITLDTTWGYSE